MQVVLKIGIYMRTDSNVDTVFCVKKKIPRRKVHYEAVVNRI